VECRRRAAEAGLSAGALYRYFRSKEEIIAAIAEEALAQVTAPMGPLAAQQPAPRWMRSSSDC
jgi:AcrR family transcriptional regulator